MSLGSLLLETLNVTLQDFDRNLLAGFWQYGSISWINFSLWLSSLIQTEQRPTHGSEIVPAGGDYILLQQGKWGPCPVALTEERARPCKPTHSNTPAWRDRKCLVTGCRFATWVKLKAAQRFPRAHEWLRKQYHHLITNPAPTSSDMHDSWDNYEFSINPDMSALILGSPDNYCIPVFINGLDDVHGLVLHLDHIADLTICPLDELFCDHFLQGVLKHIKGAGEPTWDHEDVFGDGGFDLSRQEVWGSTKGKEQLELEIFDRLFEHKVSQDLSQGFPISA
ncbi:hypothetical protein L208DRAFT_1497741 [Tricholoma matsutake]|nr:hypothetical protein L208DRAFT_1497741 [Tricholoma matsutake 945]